VKFKYCSIIIFTVYLTAWCCVCRFTITAEVSGVSGRVQSSARLFIELTVLDTNDNSPIFTQPLYICRLNLTRKEFHQQILCSVEARDRESPVEYFLDNNDSFDSFEIDSKNGSIWSRLGAQPLELLTRYELSVIAVDSGRPTRQALTQVILIIERRHDTSVIDETVSGVTGTLVYIIIYICIYLTSFGIYQIYLVYIGIYLYISH